jgi:hypothetical protein
MFRSLERIATGGALVGYNVQAAVDTENHLISKMAEQARSEMGVKTLDAVADRGYYEGEEIKAGITVTLPKPMTSTAKAAGRFGKTSIALPPVSG